MSIATSLTLDSDILDFVKNTNGRQGHFVKYHDATQCVPDEILEDPLPSPSDKASSFRREIVDPPNLQLRQTHARRKRKKKKKGCGCGGVDSDCGCILM